jgi:ABC-2 type transport system ATP-binding protein
MSGQNNNVNDSDIAVRVTGLNKHYKKSGFSLSDVSFDIPKGSIVGFIGENGAGKTTTIKLILNVIGKDSGDVAIFGKDMDSYERDIKSRIGVVFDGNRFPEMLKIRDVERIMSVTYKNWDHMEFNYYLELFGITNRKMPVKKLSQGMKMRLSIATALSHKPDLLILDEPTSGIDPIARNEILDLLANYVENGERTVLFSSHITTDIEKVADQVIYIKEGKIVFSENKDVLLEKYRVIRCGENEFKSIDKGAIVGYKLGRFGYELLASDSPELKTISGDIVIEKPSIEDIMLYFDMEVEK